MGTTENEAIVRRFVDEIFVQGRDATVDELVSDDFVGHTWPSTGDPRHDLKAAIAMTRKALADIQFAIDDVVAEDDQVVARLTTGARQVGDFMGMPPSGKSYSIEEIHWFRLRDGKVVEHWHQFDQMGLMKQLGAMPGGAKAEAKTGAKTSAQTGANDAGASTDGKAEAGTATTDSPDTAAPSR